MGKLLAGGSWLYGIENERDKKEGKSHKSLLAKRD